MRGVELTKGMEWVEVKWRVGKSKRERGVEERRQQGTDRRQGKGTEAAEDRASGGKGKGGAGRGGEYAEKTWTG